MDAKQIFFLSNIDSPYQRYTESTTPRITDAGSWRLSVLVMRGVDGSVYIEWAFKKKRARLFAYSFFLALYLMHHTGIKS